jgi:hypothetical protein
MPLSLLQVTEQPRATRSWTRVHRRQERFPGLKHFLRWQCSMQIRLQLTTLGCDCTAFSGDGRDARTNPKLLRWRCGGVPRSLGHNNLGGKDTKAADLHQLQNGLLVSP